MSYDNNVYVGWYVEFTPSDEKIQVGDSIKLQCSENANHKHGSGKFCKVCGNKLVEVLVPKFRSISPAFHIQAEKDPVEIDYMTLGRGTVDDIEKIFDVGYAVCPEFLRGKTVIVFSKLNIMNVKNHDTGVFEISPDNFQKPSDEVIELITKIFHCKDLTLKFGIVHEIV